MPPKYTSDTPLRPTVSIAIPTLNEENFIDSVIEGFATSAYSPILEILVVDGGSTDQTLPKVRAWIERDPRVKLLINPYRIQSWALNQAIMYARGDIFLRADAHCQYEPNYVVECVRALQSSGALNVGGAQRFIAEFPLQAASALAIRSFLGSGGARYKRPDYTGFAETVFLGCFWRSVLLSIGGYSQTSVVNEDYDLNARLMQGPFSTVNVTNQDSELNLHLLRGNNNAIYISSRIRVWYWPRGSCKGLIIQYYKYGRGRALTSIKHRKFFTRGIIPVCLLLLFLALLVAEIAMMGWPARSTGIAVLVSGIFLAEAVRVTVKNHEVLKMEIWRASADKLPAAWRVAGMVAVVFLIMNLCHAAGYLRQLVRILGTLRLINGRLRINPIW